MRLWRGLSKRILLAALLTGLAGGLAAGLTAVRIAGDETIEQTRVLLQRFLAAEAIPACDADPAHFSLSVPPNNLVFAYDFVSGRSRNPEAPPLPPELLRRLRTGRNYATRIGWWSQRGGTYYVVMDKQGPCSLFGIRWQVSALQRAKSIGTLLLLLALPIGLAAAAGPALVLRPLLARIEHLRRASLTVGSPTGYEPCRRPAGDELDDLAGSLDQAHERIRADAGRLDVRRRALERHLADVAHDLRTPLAALQLRMEQAARAEGPEEWSEISTAALQEVVYLAALSENLWIACQLQEGLDARMVEGRADLAQVVEQVTAGARVPARRRGISVEASRPDGPVMVRCRKVMATRAISNLVQNAVKYGDADGHVAVLLHVRGADRFELAVVDDGPGVPPADLPRLGLRTFRGDAARRRDAEGGGLGLAITHEVCRRCGWTLGFALEPPRGLRVTIAGPLLQGR